MKCQFMGSHGNIETATGAHQKHSSLKASYYHNQVIIDCGEDWQEQVADWQVVVIHVTHAHPEHAFGLTLPGLCNPEGLGRQGNFQD